MESLFRHVQWYLLKGTWWPVFEKIQFLGDITHKQIMDFSSLFRLNLTVNMLVAGNMTGEVRKSCHTIYESLLNFCALGIERAFPYHENYTSIEFRSANLTSFGK